jgi:hypothetical protein
MHQIIDLEHVVIGKVMQLCRNMLWAIKKGEAFTSPFSSQLTFHILVDP